MLPMKDRQMKIMMKKMGINMSELKATKVVIETSNNQYVCDNPVVNIMEMKGEKTYQITGDFKTQTLTNEEDIELIMEKTGESKDVAKKALKDANGDIAQAIIDLSS
jgi:nascent polypeptide-associated complex subunit alpha